MQGRILRIIARSRCGFVEREGGGDDLFFAFQDLPRGFRPQVGAILSFDEGPDPRNPDRQKAVNIQVVQIGGNQQRPTNAPLTAAWIFGEAIQTNQHNQEVPVWIRFTKNNKPVRGVGVTLEVAGITWEYPARNPQTNEDGTVYFRVILNKAEKLCDLLATCEDHKFTAAWQKKTSESAKATVIKVHRLCSFAGHELCSVLTKCGDNTSDAGVKTVILVTCSKPIQVRFRHQAVGHLTVAAHHELETDEHGQAYVGIKFVKPGDRGDVVFQIKGTHIMATEYLKSHEPKPETSAPPASGR